MTVQEAIKQFEERLKIQDYKEWISEYYEAMELAIKALEKQIEKNNNGWIPCSERLPERIGNTFGNGNKRQNVLVTLKNGIVKEMLYEFCTKEFWEAGDENPIAHWKEDATDTDLDVIAWQPLPEPYKESEEQ